MSESSLNNTTNNHYELLCKIIFISPTHDRKISGQVFRVQLSWQQDKLVVSYHGTIQKYKLVNVKMSQQGVDHTIQSDGLSLVAQGNAVNQPTILALKNAIQHYTDLKNNKNNKDKRKAVMSTSSSSATAATAYATNTSAALLVNNYSNKKQRTELRMENKTLTPMTSYSKSSGPVRRDSSPQSSSSSSLVGRKEEMKEVDDAMTGGNIGRYTSSPALRKQQPLPKSPLTESVGITSHTTSSLSKAIPSPSRPSSSSSSSSVVANLFAPQPKTFARKSTSIAYSLTSNTDKPYLHISPSLNESYSTHDNEKENSGEKQVEEDIEEVNSSISYKSIQHVKYHEKSKTGLDLFLKGSQSKQDQIVPSLKDKEREKEKEKEKQLRDAMLTTTQKATKVDSNKFFSNTREYLSENKNTSEVRVESVNNNSDWRESLWSSDKENDDTPYSPLRTPPPSKASYPPPPNNSVAITSYFSSKLDFDDTGDKYRIERPLDQQQQRIQLSMKMFKGGIRNLGNSCYMSSILQALFALPVFTKNIDAVFWSNRLVKSAEAIPAAISLEDLLPSTPPPHHIPAPSKPLHETCLNEFLRLLR